MGKTTMSETDVLAMLALLKQEWPVCMYHTLRKNCCHFSDELCQRLGVGPVPRWIMNLANAGAALASAGDPACCWTLVSQARQVCCCGPSPIASRPPVHHYVGDERIDAGDAEVLFVDGIDALPVLPPLKGTAEPKGAAVAAGGSPWAVPQEAAERVTPRPVRPM